MITDKMKLINGTMKTRSYQAVVAYNASKIARRRHDAKVQDLSCSEVESGSEGQRLMGFGSCLASQKVEDDVGIVDASSPCDEDDGRRPILEIDDDDLVLGVEQKSKGRMVCGEEVD
ncbi:hypothetical protein C2S51_001733 [Perilla frutescens var. frutescens]|nr:hypothetical protein C2S51_001733 [Perilla frutescens var. frutescens]